MHSATRCFEVPTAIAAVITCLNRFVSLMAIVLGLLQPFARWKMGTNIVCIDRVEVIVCFAPRTTNEIDQVTRGMDRRKISALFLSDFSRVRLSNVGPRQLGTQKDTLSILAVGLGYQIRDSDKGTPSFLAQTHRFGLLQKDLSRCRFLVVL